MEISLFLIFWYGVLHAFAPDHLVAIADFSIGKNKRTTFLITFLFAIGHGLSLLLLAKILTYIPITQEVLAYGDIISASVIIAMGGYLLFVVFSGRLQLRKHTHNGQEHVHIWFGKSHDHDTRDSTTSFGLGLLMGVGGVRGMLITIGAVQGGVVNMTMVGAFTCGVMLVFSLFGLVMFFVNKNLLGSLVNVRRAFLIAGLASLAVGSNIMFG